MGESRLQWPSATDTSGVSVGVDRVRVCGGGSPVKLMCPMAGCCAPLGGKWCQKSHPVKGRPLQGKADIVVTSQQRLVFPSHFGAIAQPYIGLAANFSPPISHVVCFYWFAWAHQ
eukprot:993263-Amphidinium_carterae.1